MGGIFDDGIDAEEMAVILGVTDEIEEEAKANKISNEPLTPEEMLKTGNEIFDNPEYEEDYSGNDNEDYNDEY